MAAIAAFDGTIYVDFDETLYLRNSTEDFIDLAAPGLAAAIILKLLDIIGPWRFTGGAATRDIFRLAAIRFLFPWTILRWRATCRRSAAQRTNAPLWRAIRDKQIIIASNGFTPLIRPMLDAMGGAHIPLIACAPFGFHQRRAGKAAAISAHALACAMLITDSTDDAAALALCARPVLVKWRAAAHRRALARIYLPGDYLSLVKRPGQPGVLRQLCLEDLGFWLLLTATASPPSARILAGICLLFASFWSIYEAGYAENDRCAARFEAHPVLTRQARGFDHQYFEAKTWAAAGLCAAAGLALLPRANPLAWAAALLALRAIYAIYNRIDKHTRIWLYPALQWFRSLVLLVILPAAPIAMLAGGAQIAARSLGYFAYRLTQAEASAWPALPLRLIQMLFFLLALTTLRLATGCHMPLPACAIFLAWNLLLARRELRAAIRRAHRIDRAA